MHPDLADPARRAALYRLFDAVWPGLGGRIPVAAAMGWDWAAVSTPFARFENGEAVAHVGVLDLPVWIDGRERRVAGLHAVCTHPDHRGRGHFRALMDEALAWTDERFALAQLGTGQPALYEPFGFRVLPRRGFLLDADHPGGGTARPVDTDDLPWIHDLLGRRAPTSDLYTPLEGGWLVGIDEVLWTGGLEHFHRVQTANAAEPVLVAWEVEGDLLRLIDVVWSAPVPLAEILAACPWPFARVELQVHPDLLAPGATPAPWPEDDVMMVRGDWPALGTAAGGLAVSPLALH